MRAIGTPYLLIPQGAEPKKMVQPLLIFESLTYSQNHGEVSRKYYVLTEISTCTHKSIYVYLLQRVRCTHFGKCAHLQKPVSELYKQLVEID